MTDETADRAPGSPEESAIVDLTAEVPPVDLGPVAFLRPDAPGTTPMPADVWDRLSAALAEEARKRPEVADTPSRESAPGSDEPAVVIPLSRARSSRPMRWAGGLVAAGVVVVAGAAVIPGIVGGTAIVATDPSSSAVLAEGGARASTPSTAAESDAAADSNAAAGTDAASGSDTSSGSDAAAQAETAPMAAAEMAPAGEPAAKIVLASNTVYAPSTLRDQVVDLVRTRFSSVEQAMAAPSEEWLPPVAGFTQTWAALRDCLTALTQSPDLTALLVDRGTYEGQPAGVIVAPDRGVDYAAAVDSASPAASPTETVLTSDGLFDVWVVDQECEQPTMTTLDNIAPFAR